ncbi:MAG: acetate--CoA ligase family protein [Candidatus Nanopelagicales bacterium]
MGGNLEFFHSPASVAVVGASDDPEKIGGRPLRYMREFGFRGVVVPVNPGRSTVQGIPAVASLEEAHVVPEVVLIGVPGEAAVQAVEAAARMGSRGAVIMSSGFGETDDPVGHERQARMELAASSAGMRLVGPNSQGLASFHTGTVLGFSTMFTEQPPADGPVAVVSQSGAMASVPYGLLRRRGIGVRYVHGTGNDMDVTVGELAETILHDEDVRLVLLYLEDLGSPHTLERAAMLAAQREVPVVALVGGRSAAGRKAAASHTGALASEQRVVDAFLERCGVWRAASVADLVASAELYLGGWRPRGRRLAIVSNSGAVCVLGADAASTAGLEIAELSQESVTRLEKTLPTFATKTNPIDITAGLLTDSSLVGGVLEVLADDPNVDACFVGIPVSGRGYDFPRFGRDIAAFARGDSKPVVVASPQPPVADEFRSNGLVVFDEESAAIAALGQMLRHHELMARSRGRAARGAHEPRPGRTRVLSETDALALLSRAGVPVVPTRTCVGPEAAAAAFRDLGSGRVVVKGLPRSATHKSELGLVAVGLADAESVSDAARQMIERMDGLALEHDGVVVMPMVSAVREVLVGAHVDARFGPTVLVGAGGTYVEALDDVQLLLPPFDDADVRAAVDRLHIAPLLPGVRGEPPADVQAWVDAAQAVARLVLEDPTVVSVDVNPFMLHAVGEGGAAVDAVVVVAD